MVSNLRIGGLASGIDTESIIKQMMQAQRIPVDKLTQDKQIYEWQQEDFRDINTSLLLFRNTVSDMRLQSPYLTCKVATSNDQVATATAVSSAIPGSHTISVTQLARGASITGAGHISASTDHSTLAKQFGITAESAAITGGAAYNDAINLSSLTDEKITINIDGKDYTIKTDQLKTHTAGAGNLVTLIQNAVDGSGNKLSSVATVSMDSSQRISITSNSTGKSAPSIVKWTAAGTNTNTLSSAFGVTSGTADYAADDYKELEINGVLFKVGVGSTSISELVSRINRTTEGVSLNTTQKAADTIAQKQELRLTDDALKEGLTFTLADKNGHSKRIALWDSSAGDYVNEASAKTALNADYVVDINSKHADEVVTSIYNLVSADNSWSGVASFAKSIDSNDHIGTLEIDSLAVGTGNAVTTNVAGGSIWSVKASYDETLDRFFLATDKMGQDQYIKINDDELAQKLLKADNSDFDTRDLTSADGANVKLINGQNAIVNIDGLDITDYDSNKFTLNNITYSITEEGSSTINIERDTDAVYKKIEDFVNAYNENVEKLKDKIYETKYSDYKPLTEEQKGQLSDDQIKQWEDKARSGLLRRDPLLTDILSRMRSTMSHVVTNEISSENHTSLSSIGINTTSNYQSAKLEINEDALKEALQKDPEGVMELFTKASDEYSDQGISKRLYDDVTYAIDSILEKAGVDGGFSQVDDSALGKNISSIDDNIQAMEDRLTDVEDRYWRQFTAMEQAIQQLNSQSTWLMQQFGGTSQQ